jgi:predicted transcriptional regulator of viral defense system
MTGTIDAVAAVSGLAAGQWGLVTTAQARLHAGITAQQLKKLADRGVLHRLRHGVYAAVGAPPTPWDQLRAAWLAADPGRLAQDRLEDPDPVVVSHATAANLHRLGDLAADHLDLTSPVRRSTRDRDVRFHRGALSGGRWTVVDGLPVTTVITTARDLARAGTDGGHLAGVVRDAVLTAHVDVEELAAALAPTAPRYGVPLGHGRDLLALLMAAAGVPADQAAAALAPAPAGFTGEGTLGVEGVPG